MKILLRAVLLGVMTLLALLLGELGLRLGGFSFHFYPEEIRVGWPNPKIIKDAFQEDPDLYPCATWPPTFRSCRCAI